MHINIYHLMMMMMIAERITATMTPDMIQGVLLDPTETEKEKLID